MDWISIADDSILKNNSLIQKEYLFDFFSIKNEKLNPNITNSNSFEKQFSSFEIGPNPTSNRLKIKISNPSNSLNYILTDLNGKVVFG